MSTFTKLTWPIQDLSAVCALQLSVAPGKLSLSGTLADLSIPDQVSFIKAKMTRSISISSTTNDYTGTTFTIEGLQNGAYVTENIFPGPNSDATVYGTQYYDIITSVTSSTAITGAPNTGIRVGTGDAGFFPLIVVNTAATIINYSATVLVRSTPPSGINYELFQTLDEVSNNFIPLVNQLTTRFFPNALGITGTGPQIGNSSAITNFVLFQIISSTTPATDTLDFIFLQE
jgi:hypothetical protein